MRSFSSLLFSLVPLLSVAILTVTAVLSVIKSRNDIPSLTFVISLYFSLLLLFLFLHIHGRLSDDDVRKEKLKTPIWVFATMANAIFTYRISGFLTLPLDFIAWTMAACTSISGFYFFFFSDEKTNFKVVAHGSLDPKSDSSVKSSEFEAFVAGKV